MSNKVKIEPDSLVFLGCMLAWFAWALMQLTQTV